MEEAVRAATPEDLPAIVGLVEALRAELTPMRGGRIWAVREARPGPPAEVYGALLTDPATYRIVTIFRRLSRKKRDPMAGLVRGFARSESSARSDRES